MAPGGFAAECFDTDAALPGRAGQGGLWLLRSWWRQTHGIGFLMQICICHLLPVDIIRRGITVLVGAASQLLSAESKG